MIDIQCKNSLDVYPFLTPPSVIISDGPYGIRGYTGDLDSPEKLPSFYEPHVEAWASVPSETTTLYFWNTEIGWANVHPILVKHGWVYKRCFVWNKGHSHIAGNVNSKTIQSLPCVTEVCVHYVRDLTKTKEWMNSEWRRTGLTLQEANKACEVKNAASRKYLCKDSAWYFPPDDLFEKMVDYANCQGNQEGIPYFSLDGKSPISREYYDKVRPASKFKCPFGVTNVWDHPPLRNSERVKLGTKSLHPNQKPLALMERLVEMSSDVGDFVLEPFGGLCTAALACKKLERSCLSVEMNKEIHAAALKRLNAPLKTGFLR